MSTLYSRGLRLKVRIESVKRIVLIILLLSTVAKADVKVFGDGERLIWFNNSQTFSISASSSMSATVAYIWPDDAGTVGEALLTDGTNQLNWGEPTVGSTTTPHDILSATHSDAAASAIARGAIIVGNATPKWSKLTIGAAATILRSDGTDASWSATTNITTLGTIVTGTWNATAIDISDYTNLTVTAPVTLTDDDVGITIAKDIVAGVGLSGGENDVLPGADADTTLTFDATELDAITWSDGANASNAWTFDVSGTDTTMTFGNDLITISNSLTIATGKNIKLGSTQWNSSDEIDGTKIKDADYGDVDVSAGGAWTVSSVQNNSVALGTDTTGNYVLSITDGLAIDGGDGGSEGAALTLAFDPTELLGSRTWGDASTDTIVWTWDRATGTDPTMTFGNDFISLNGDLKILGDDLYMTTNTDRFVLMGDGTNYNPEAIDLGTDTAGDYVKDVADGTGIDGTATGEGSTYTPSFDATELDALTWSDGANASNIWTFDVSGTDTTMTFGNDLISMSGSLTIGTGKNIKLGTTQWNSADEIDGTKIKDADYGDVDVSAGGAWTVSSVQANSVALGTDTTGDYVADITGGAGIDSTGGTSGENISHTLSFDSTELDALTWSDGSNATNVWTFDVSGTDHTITAGSGLITLSHNLTVADTTTTADLKVSNLAQIGDGGVQDYTEVDSTGDIDFKGQAGLAFGELAAEENTTPTTISTQNVGAQVTIFDIELHNHNVTTSIPNSDMTIVQPGHYMVSISATVESVAGLGSTAAFRCRTNNNDHDIIPHTHRDFSGGSGESGPMSLSGIADLLADDTVELWITNQTNTANYLVESVSMAIVQIGGPRPELLILEGGTADGEFLIIEGGAADGELLLLEAMI